MNYTTRKDGLPRGVKNIIGEQFGYLSVLSFSHLHTQPCGLTMAYWTCKCLKCGRICIVARASLRDGQQTCGCLKKEIGKRTVIHGCWSKDNTDPLIKHIYFSWKSMKARCDNPKATGYKNYGGRGITYCPKWEKFVGFLEDMRGTYFAGASLDRKDVNGNYDKENCRWATDLEQCNNTRFNLFLECNGIERTLSQWSRLTKISRAVIRSRLASGWTPRQALEFQDSPE